MDFYINVIAFVIILSAYFYFVFSKKTPTLLRVFLLCGAFYMSLFPFLLGKPVAELLGEGYMYYANTLNTFFVATLILFFLLCGAKLFSLLKPNNKCAFVLLSLSLFLSLFALYEGLKVPNVKEVEVISSKIVVDKKVVFLSDIHINRHLSLNKLKGLVEKVNSLKPDVIILGGDILDDAFVKNKPYVEVLEKLQAKDGKYFVSGNHEVYRGLIPSVQQLKKAGFVYLNNNGFDVDKGLFVAGIPDIRAQKKNVDIKKTFENANSDKYKILVSHTPYNFAKNNNFDLMLSGHTHGGQIFPFHIFAKVQHKYLTGFYDMDNGAKIYVSRGAGQWGPQIRLLSPAEITVINFVKK